MKRVHAFLLLTTTQYEVAAQWGAGYSNPSSSPDKYKTECQRTSATQEYPTSAWSSLWNTRTLPGGDLYAGPGGPCYDGPGGPLYAGPGGPLYAGPGGPCHTGFASSSMFGEPKKKPTTCPAKCLPKVAKQPDVGYANPSSSSDKYKTKSQRTSATQAYSTPKWPSLYTRTLPGGDLYAGPGGSCYDGPGGPCFTGFSSFFMFGEPKEKPATCPKKCSQ